MPTPYEILNDFYKNRKTGYDLDLPGLHDTKFIELAEQYAHSDAVERQWIRSGVNPECRLLLIGFGDRLAILADRKGNRRLLFLALLAHAIEDFRYDDRENIVRLALIHHIATKLGETPSKLFEEASRLSSSQAAEKLRAFERRPPELKSLQAMKIIEIKTESGVDYRYH